MKWWARNCAAGFGMLLPLVSAGADLDEVTIRVIDLDAERPDAVTREIQLPEGTGPESALLPVDPASAKVGPGATESPAVDTAVERAESVTAPGRTPEPAGERTESPRAGRAADTERGRPEGRGAPERGGPAEPPAALERARPEPPRIPEAARPAERERAVEPPAADRARGLDRAREAAQQREESERGAGARARGVGRERDR